MFIINWKRKGRPKPVHLLPYFTALFATLLADHFLTNWEKAAVFGGVELQHNTLTQILHSGPGRMLTPKGLAVLGKAVVGWIFHSEAATFGLAFAGLLAMLLAILFALRKREAVKDGDIVSALGVICYFGAFALGLLFFFHYLYDYWTGASVERCDRLVFGRYLESGLPVLFMAGLLKLDSIQGRTEENRWLLPVAGILLALCTGFVAVFIAPSMTGSDCYVHSLVALNLFMDTDVVKTTQDVIPNLGSAVCWFGVVSLAVYAAIWALSGKHKKLTYGLIALLFLLVYVRSFSTILYRVDSAGLTKFAEFYLSQ